MSAPLVVFDMDGTLADTLGDIAASLNHVLAGRGLPAHPLAAYRDFVGDGIAELCARAAPAAPDLHGIVEEFRRHYGDHLFDTTRPYPGVDELLDGLAAAAIPVAVLSNKIRSATEEMARRLFARHSFIAVLGEEPGVPRKPDPGGALRLCRLASAPPARALLVGDSGIDIQTAARAGMIGVGVRWGFRGEDELRRAGAQHIVSTPAEILELAR